MQISFKPEKITQPTVTDIFVNPRKNFCLAGRQKNKFAS